MAVGPSTTQTPYIVGSEPNIRFTSIVSAGDSLGLRPDGVANRMVGIPDGLGAFDNGNGTITVLMNHEIGATAGIVREHGAIGSFVSELVIDKATLRVVSAGDLAKDVFLYNSATGGFTGDTPTAFNRFCSADLAVQSAFFDAASGLGTRERIYLTGEESGAEGRAFGFVASGAEKGRAFELAALGNFSWENAVASPGSGAKTVVIGLDDSTPGQIYVYVGDKKASGLAVDRAGLTSGVTFGIKVEGVRLEDNNTVLAGDRARFTLEALGDLSRKTGAELETQSDAQGVTEFFRPEDGAWDPTNPNRFYFVTTANITSNSRLWALDFTDVKNPAAGGTITMLLRGDEGHRMADNLTVANDGKVLFQEDPGGNPRLAKVWQYDPATDRVVQMGEHDPARFLAPVAPFSQDEESSGIIDVTGLLGNADTQAFLLDVQAHYGFGAPGSADRQEIVQGGQLMVMYVDKPRDGGAGNDAVNGGADDDRLSGGAGDDVIQGGSGNDLLGGGAGVDRILGGAGDDFIGGESGDDTISGGLGVDELFGDAGDDLIGGGDGADGLFGGDGDDFMGGEAGNDFLDGGSGVDVLFGDAGNDEVTGGAGADRLFGGDGDDRLSGQTGDDLLRGGAGADLMGGGAGADRIIGEDGDDFVGGEDGDDTISGDAGVDVLFGDAGNDLIGGGIGNDRLFGGDGDDFMGGEADNDLLDGGRGVDVLFGDAGDDVLVGGAQNDRLFGGDGADVLHGQAGDDLLDGGAGTDTAVFKGARSSYTVTTRDGVTTVTGSDGSDQLFGIERLQFDDGAVDLRSASPSWDDCLVAPPANEWGLSPLPTDDFVV